MTLILGDKAPKFSLRDQNGVTRSSTDLKGKSLVLFFYPKDETPGCTAEACSFRDNFDDFKTLGAEVWGVSGDTEDSHRSFSERYRLPFPLLSDRSNNLRKSFHVPKTLGIVPGRVTYVIDGQGIIRLVFNNLLDGPAHIREALRVLKQSNPQK